MAVATEKNNESTVTEEPAPKAETPVEEKAFSIDDLFPEDSAGSNPQEPTPPAEAKETPKQPTGDKPASEKPTEIPPVEEKKEEAVPPTETVEPKPIPKHEREAYKLREARRAAEAETAAVKKENADLKAQLGIELTPEQAEPDLVQQAAFNERVRIAKEQFIHDENFGPDVLEAKLLGEGSPWMELEAKAKAGDAAAIALVSRSYAALNPLKEAMVILEEQELFETHGTRSLSAILEKQKEDVAKELEEKITKDVLAKLQPTQPETGAVPPTLGGAPGEIPEVKASNDADEGFSVHTFFPE